MLKQYIVNKELEKNRFVKEKDLVDHYYFLDRSF